MRRTNKIPVAGLLATSLLAAVPVTLPLCLKAQSTAPNASYLEFGTVSAIGRSDVRVTLTEPRNGVAVERSFTLSRETRADLVHIGDNVEVIYSRSADGKLLLDRLIALRGEIPRFGPAPEVSAPAVVGSAPPVASAPAVVAAPPPVKAPAPSVSSAPPPIAAAKHTKPSRSHPAPSNRTARASTAVRPSGSSALPAASVPAVSGARAIALGNAAQAQVPAVSQVPLGGSARVVNPEAPPRATPVVQQPVGELCDRTADWSAQPATLAVLDFRYPTEREEARDIAQVGGGSGTALADQVYSQLADDPHFALSRGDRDKVFRMDFAGAARLGRQLGVDAVLLGTFVPVETPNPDPDFPQPTQAYTLRAGIVETCTGELLYKLESGDQITAKQAANPKANLAGFAMPIANLLAPVFAGGVSAGVFGDAGTVTEVRGVQVTLHLSTGVSLRAGDEVGVHASRLAKIPSTNTLHVFRNELIGRVTVDRVSGQYAYGTFSGEPAPLPGDTADRIRE